MSLLPSPGGMGRLLVHKLRHLVAGLALQGASIENYIAGTHPSGYMRTRMFLADLPLSSYIGMYGVLHPSQEVCKG